MESEARPVPFVSLSGFLHVAAFFLVSLFAADFIQKPAAPQSVEIEILSSPAPAARASLPEPKLESAPQIEKAQIPQPPAKLPVAKIQTQEPSVQKASSEDVVIAAQKQTPAAKSPAVSRAPRIAKSTQAPKAQARAVTTPQSATPYHSPTPLEPVAVPDLVTADLEDAPQVRSAQLDQKSFEDDLDQLTKEDRAIQQKELAALNQDFEKEANSIAAEQLGKLSLAEKQIQEQDKKLAALTAQTKRENQNKLSQALKAQAEAQAKAEREGQIRAAAAAKAQALAAAQQAAQAKAAAAAGTGDGSAGGVGAQASNGIGVRGIEDLKQKPGNTRPKYDEEERFQRKQGEVVFVAYVTKDGSLTNFKLLQSSGHRSLDYKTLKALKDWKFYPGQEGIVEIPFRWDLKGGPQEKATRLRGVSVGQN